jgi:hypothetical protein
MGIMKTVDSAEKRTGTALDRLCVNDKGMGDDADEDDEAGVDHQLDFRVESAYRPLRAMGDVAARRPLYI